MISRNSYNPLTPIKYVNPFTKETAEVGNDGLTDASGTKFPLIKGAYRLVTSDNYTDNFGFQWNRFVTTQLDKSGDLDLSRKRFFAVTGWDKENLSGQNILEVGSGAGRFSQIVLDYTNANLYSVDYSKAVEANYKNNGPHQRLKLFQASIYDLPFAGEQFDKVFCFGVLQHTPDVEKSIKCLVDMVKEGGELVVDFYPLHGWWTKLHSKYLLRPFTKKMTNERLFNKINNNIDRLIKTYQFIEKIGLGNVLNRFVPVCDINGTLPGNLPYSKLRELCVLDTFDMFSPQFDQPQKIKTIKEWFFKYGIEDNWGGNIKYENCKVTIVKGYKKSISAAR